MQGERGEKIRHAAATLGLTIVRNENPSASFGKTRWITSYLRSGRDCAVQGSKLLLANEIAPTRIANFIAAR
jgi:hypothetical protein